MTGGQCFVETPNKVLFFFLGSCAHSLTDLQGNFSSPNYPFNYPHHLNCMWSIIVTPGSYIHLQFSNFSLENGDSDCEFDYVEVFDSNYPLSSMPIKRCGDQSPCVFGARAMSYMFYSLLISLFQLQGSWHIMQLTGILAAETACLLMQHKVRKYSQRMSRNYPNFMQTDFDKRY